jgi:hypothetical protein
MILAEDWIWWNYVEGLFMADAIGHFAVAGVPKAAAYSIYEGTPGSDEFPLFGKIRGDTLSLRMAGHALKLYNAHFSGSLVHTISDIDGLNAYGCISEGDTLTVFVVNKKLNVDFATTIGIHNFLPNGTVKVWDIRHDTTFAAPWNGTKGITYRGEYEISPVGLTYAFPKASVTLLLIPPEEFTTEDVASNVTQSIKLEQNNPNPFSTRTTISFWAPNPERVELRIYDLTGRRVKTLRSTSAGKSLHSLTWDGTTDSNHPLRSGVYLYRLLCDNVASSPRRLTLLR